MDDPVKRFIDDAMKTPLDQLMKALIESGTPKPEDQIDLSWGGVAYCAQRLSLQGNNYWRVLFTGIPIPEYHHLEKGSMAHGIFYSLGGELFNEFTLLDITPRSDSFNFFPLLDSPLDKPLNTLNLRRCQDLQTAVLYAKQFIETYKKYQNGIEAGLNLIQATDFSDFDFDLQDCENLLNQQLRDKMGLDFIVSGYRDFGTFKGIDYITQYGGGRQGNRDGRVVYESVVWKIILAGIPTDIDPKDLSMRQGPKCQHLEELFQGIGDAVYFVERHRTTNSLYRPYINIRAPYPQDIKPFSKAVGSTAHLAVETAKAAIQRYLDDAPNCDR